MAYGTRGIHIMLVARSTPCRAAQHNWVKMKGCLHKGTHTLSQRAGIFMCVKYETKPALADYYV